MDSSDTTDAFIMHHLMKRRNSRIFCLPNTIWLDSLYFMHMKNNSMLVQELPLPTLDRNSGFHQQDNVCGLYYRNVLHARKLKGGHSKRQVPRYCLNVESRTHHPLLRRSWLHRGTKRMQKWRNCTQGVRLSLHMRVDESCPFRTCIRLVRGVILTSLQQILQPEVRA